VAVDLQNDFCHPTGAFGRLGCDMSAYPAAIDRASALLRVAEAAGSLTVLVMNNTLPNTLSDSPAQLRMAWRARPPRSDHFPFTYTVAGTWGQELVDDLYKPPAAITIEKHRSSAFAGTSLDTILRSNGIRTTLVVGCTTEGCVDSTARDAGFLDYFPVVVSDAVATVDQRLHDAALAVLGAYRADIASSRDVTSLWDRTGVGAL
jgi:nicotinamidase-related amidase